MEEKGKDIKLNEAKFDDDKNIDISKDYVEKEHGCDNEFFKSIYIESDMDGVSSKKTIKMKKIIIIAVCILVCVGCIVTAMFLNKDEKEDEKIFYIKDGNLLAYEEGWKEGKKITDCNGTCMEFVLLSDKSGIYYLESDDGKRGEIYYADIKKTGKKVGKSVKIASDVPVNDRIGMKLFDDKYLIFEIYNYSWRYGGSESLYCYNGKCVNEIFDKPVEKYYYGANKIVFQSNDSIYSIKLDDVSTIEELATDVEEIIYCDSDLENIKYSKKYDSEEKDYITYDLYEIKKGESEKFATDAINYNFIENNDVIYYTISNGDDASIYERLIKDDYAESDAKAIEPSMSDYKVRKKYSFLGISFSDTDWDSYNEAWERFEPISERKRVREKLKEGLGGYNHSGTLYSYSDGKKIEIDTNVIWFAPFGNGIRYEKYDESHKNSTSISIEDFVKDASLFDEINIWLGEEFFMGDQYYCGDARKGILLAKKSELGDFGKIYALGDEKFIVKTADINNRILKENADGFRWYVYKAKVGTISNKVTNLETIFDEVERIQILGNCMISYKDITEDDCGEAYIYKEGKSSKLSSGVWSGDVNSLAYKNNICYYLTNGGFGVGSLFKNMDSKNSKVGDNVICYKCVNDKIYFVEKTGKNRNIGDLMLMDAKGQIKKIDSDVSQIF